MAANSAVSNKYGHSATEKFGVNGTMWIQLIAIFLLNFTSSFAETVKVELLAANQAASRMEVYLLKFQCNQSSCTPDLVTAQCKIWQSPVMPGMYEAKRVTYLGQDAVITTTSKGAIVWSYPGGQVLFHRELVDAITYMHGLEVLPDGNVSYAESFGTVGILYREGNVVNQYKKNTPIMPVRYAHQVMWHKQQQRLYALGYLDIHVFEYTNGRLVEVKRINFTAYYDSKNKNEPPMTEDGGHDFYPIDNTSNSTLFMSTGEHLFYYNADTDEITRSSYLYTIPSKNSRAAPAKEVPDKGGIKGVSRNLQSGIVLTHAAPWFKELYKSGKDKNYGYSTDNLIWLWPERQLCMTPDYDITTACKVKFGFTIRFYKARNFAASAFSYDIVNGNDGSNRTTTTC